MIRLRWVFERAIATLGPAGLAGTAILLITFGLALYDGLVTRAATRQLRAEVHTLALHPGSAASAPLLDTPAQLAYFYAALPPESELHTLLGTIVAAGQRQGIAVPEGEFKLVTEPGNPVVCYQILLPLKAGYRETRQFIREAMRAVPTLALEDVSFRRDSANAALLDGRVAMALYLRAAKPGAPQ